MVIEIKLPDDWPPALGFMMARLLRQTLAEGFPVVAAVRPDVTDEELSEAFTRVREAITEAGLAALYRLREAEHPVRVVGRLHPGQSSVVPAVIRLPPVR
jgi:hypothetical protein